MMQKHPNKILMLVSGQQILGQKIRRILVRVDIGHLPLVACGPSQSDKQYSAISSLMLIWAETYYTGPI